MKENTSQSHPKSRWFLLHSLKRWIHPTGPKEPVSEKDVRDAELNKIPRHLDTSDGLLGLAFSGGGIRSATFNLGVLQALAERKLLRKVDYLSTVSGGGYIGSWLSAWTQRKGNIEEVEKDLDPRAAVNYEGKEPPPVEFLRRYSNYLTPRTGLLSTDTLAGVTTYMRNLILNLVMLVSVLSLILLLPRIVAWASTVSLVHSKAAAIVFLFIAALFINLNLAYQLDDQSKQERFFTKQLFILCLIVLPLTLAAWLISVLMVSEDRVFLFGPTILWFGGVWVFAWVLAEVFLGTVKIQWKKAWIVLPALLVALVLGVALIGVVQEILHENIKDEGLLWHWTVLGVPTLLTIFGLAVVLQIGLANRVFAEESREWWSRLGAWLIAVGGSWVVLCAAAIYGPFIVMLLMEWITSLGLAWVISTAAGVVLGKSKFTSGPSANKWLELATCATPYVFVAGLLLAIAYGIHETVLKAFDLSYVGETSFSQYAFVLNGTLSGRPEFGALTPYLAFLAIAAFLIWRLDINLFSLHMFYRNRLKRCYLGASNEKRHEHPFTGFDPDDDLKLSDLPLRPFHIINVALNLTKANNLAWQERKGASFVFTPLYSGYALPGPKPYAGPQMGYQETQDYLSDLGKEGWVSVGEAMTISGAAASPNMGNHSSKAVAFLLTVFNVRLGWWMQNPGKLGAWNKPGPRFGLYYLLKELFGLADEKSEYVYLSDGGHFENLGIYELVRRRCRFIVAVDAGMDRQFGFEDLGNAVRKCQVDFGVPIEIDTRAIIPDPKTGRSLYHCAVGRIRYERADKKESPGFLLYIKPSLTGNEPIDVSQYAVVHPDFPHQSTTDQWFDESQFESYRKLGYHIASTVFDETKVKQQGSLGDLFVDLSQRWYRPSMWIEANFTRHAEELRSLRDTLSKSENLKFLDSQIFPEWEDLMKGNAIVPQTSLWLPDSP